MSLLDENFDITLSIGDRSRVYTINHDGYVDVAMQTRDAIKSLRTCSVPAIQQAIFDAFHGRYNISAQFINVGWLVYDDRLYIPPHTLIEVRIIDERTICRQVIAVIGEQVSTKSGVQRYCDMPVNYIQSIYGNYYRETNEREILINFNFNSADDAIRAYMRGACGISYDHAFYTRFVEYRED